VEVYPAVRCSPLTFYTVFYYFIVVAPHKEKRGIQNIQNIFQIIIIQVATPDYQVNYTKPAPGLGAIYKWYKCVT
jgi:hypothetical protein